MFSGVCLHQRKSIHCRSDNCVQLVTGQGGHILSGLSAAKAVQLTRTKRLLYELMGFEDDFCITVHYVVILKPELEKL